MPQAQIIWKIIIVKILLVFQIVLVLIALYFFIAIILSFSPVNTPLPVCFPEKDIYISSNGIHADIIIPAHELDSDFLVQLQPLPGTQFIAFGWGDKNFYINTPEWKDLTFPVAFRALFLKSETAMHVTYYPWKGRNWTSVKICNQQLQSLIVYIESTFKNDQQGQLVKMEFEGYNKFDRFFEAEGSFSLITTCNTWVNTGFKQSEISTAVWTPFDLGVLYHIN